VTPSQTEIKTFLLRQVEAWNAGDREGFVALHRAIAPAGVSVENPVGSPPERGWQALDTLWDAYQARTKLAYDTVITSPSGEAAVLEQITAEHEGQPVVRHSLHTYDFAGDSFAARYYVIQTAPTGRAAADRLRTFLLTQVEAWNAGDRERCLGLYDEISGGRYFLEFPLGADEVPGRPVIEQFWDTMQATTRLTIDHIAVSDDGHEAALYVRNVHAHDDGTSDTNVSIEIYRLADDGLHIRYFSQADSA
jgi:hypothetical protein